MVCTQHPFDVSVLSACSGNQTITVALRNKLCHDRIHNVSIFVELTFDVLCSRFPDCLHCNVMLCHVMSCNVM